MTTLQEHEAVITDLRTARNEIAGKKNQAQAEIRILTQQSAASTDPVAIGQLQTQRLALESLLSNLDGKLWQADKDLKTAENARNETQRIIDAIGGNLVALRHYVKHDGPRILDERRHAFEQITSELETTRARILTAEDQLRTLAGDHPALDPNYRASRNQ